MPVMMDHQPARDVPRMEHRVRALLAGDGQVVGGEGSVERHGK